MTGEGNIVSCEDTIFPHCFARASGSPDDLPFVGSMSRSRRGTKLGHQSDRARVPLDRGVGLSDDAQVVCRLSPSGSADLACDQAVIFRVGE
jgi:hypothetical protein